MTGSDHICGDDKLGILPERDPEYPLRDRISLPRMITAQMDKIFTDQVLKKYTDGLREGLEELVRVRHDHQAWLTIYVIFFLILYDIGFICRDRRRHAIQNWVTDVTRFSSLFSCR